MGKFLDGSGLAALVKLIKSGTTQKTISLTYSQLKTLRDGNKLVPGQSYRITDFVTTTTQAETRSAGHPFDVIVVADSASKLNENARAALHEGDTYFTTSKLEAWELKYSLDNDTTKYSWADATNGKGVIWWMKDEWNNECFYDFKNIQYKVYAVSGDDWNTYCTDNSNGVFPSSAIPYRLTKNMAVKRGKKYTWTRSDTDFVYAYTWSNYNGSTKGMDDSSCYTNSPTGICNNKINGYFVGSALTLNFVMAIPMDKTNGPKLIKASGNVIGENCHDIILSTSCSDCVCGNNCEDIICGVLCYSWACGDNCAGWTCGNQCTRWKCGNDCVNWVCAHNCSSWTCGNNCADWVCAQGCLYWKCGHSCFRWSCLDNCSGWICGNSCTDWSCEDNCSGWTCGNNCSGWTCGESSENWHCGNNCINWSCMPGCVDWACGDGCSGWTCQYICSEWKCGNGCSGWTCQENSSYWKCGNYCTDWTCEGESSSWTCGNECSGWYCRDHSSNWRCGNRCSNWRCGTGSSDWGCGNNCSGWTCGINCCAWSCGEYCVNWICGDDCVGWICGNDCVNWICGESETNLQDYCIYFHLDSGVSYVNFSLSNKNTDNTKVFKNFTIKSGVSGTSSTPLKIVVDTANFPLNSNYQWTIAKNSKGEIKQYCEADLIN